MDSCWGLVKILWDQRQSTRSVYLLPLLFHLLITLQGQLRYPIGVGVDPRNGNIIVAENLNHRIQIFDVEGHSLKIFGQSGDKPGEFSCPWGLCVDREGLIFVLDENNSRVQQFSPEGDFLKFIGQAHGDLRNPKNLCLDSEGNLIVADTKNHRICIFG